MHELSLAESMRELIIERATAEDFDTVTKVCIEIGELSHVQSDAMAFCFEAAMAGSPAEQAKLEIVTKCGQGQCRSCGQTSTMSYRYDPCSFCGAFGLEVVAGDSVRLLTLDVKQVTCER